MLSRNISRASYLAAELDAVTAAIALLRMGGQVSALQLRDPEQQDHTIDVRFEPPGPKLDHLLAAMQEVAAQIGRELTSLGVQVEGAAADRARR